MKRLELAGKRYGRLTPLVICGRIGSFAAWKCVCDCGNEVRISSRAIVSGHTKSCGCFRRDFTTAKNLKHGECGTTEFRSWASLRQRCTNPNNKKYPIYGGRGIGFCERWDSFANFLADMGKKPSPSHTIDRIDNNLGYSPENCRWATPLQQSRNKQKTRFATIDGVTKTTSEWAKINGLSQGMVIKRIKRGWSNEKAVSEPAKANT